MIKFCPKCQAETERRPRGRCKPCANAHKAAWRAANPEKTRAYAAVYRAANAKQELAKQAAYRATNPEKVKARDAVYRAANKEYIAAYRAANLEKAKAVNAAWAKANPEARRIMAQNRRARKRASGGVLSRGLSAKLFKLQKGKCACCGLPLGKIFQLDHVMPIALGGSNTDDNIQLLRQRCNQQKHAAHPVDFMQSRGFLL